MDRNREDSVAREGCELQMNHLVAIVGMCGSGKSKVTEFFINKGWNCIYFGGVTISELEKNDLPINEENERVVREQLRRELGPAAFAIKLENSIRESVEKCNTVLDGLYSWQEYTRLKETFGDNLVVVAIVTNRFIRYNRLSNRMIRPLTAEDAEKRDYAEIEYLYKGGPIAIADYYIDNNSNEASLMNQIDELLKGIGT